MIFNGYVWLEVKRDNGVYMIPSSLQDLGDCYFEDVFPGPFSLGQDIPNMTLLKNLSDF